MDGYGHGPMVPHRLPHGMGSGSVSNASPGLLDAWAWRLLGRLGLRAKLVALVVLALTPVFVFESGQIYVRFHDRTAQEAQATLEAADTLGSAFDDFLRHQWDVEENAGVPATSTVVPLDASRLERVVLSDLPLGSPITSRSWMDPQGLVLASSDPTWVGTPGPDADLTARIRQGETEVVSDLISPAAGGEPYLLVARAMRSQNALLGIVAETVDVGQLDRVLPVQRYGYRNFSLVDSQGAVVYCTGPDVRPVGQRVASGSAARQALKGRVTVSPNDAGSHGIARIGAAVPLASIGWAAYAWTPVRQVLSAAERQAVWELLVLLAIAAVSVAVALALGRRLTDPVQALRVAATAISRGDLTARVHVAGSDELAVAGLAFDRMADRIAELETELDRFFTLSGDLFCILDSDGRMRRLNPACSAALGFSAEELQSRPWLDFVHPEDRNAVLQEWEALTQSGAPVAAEYRLLRQDGGYRWVFWNATAHGGVVYAVGHDVTERMRIEEALAASNDRFSALIAASPVPIVATERDRVTMWNPAAEQAFGWNEYEVLGRPLPIVPDGGPDEGWGPNLGSLPETVQGATVRRVRRDGRRLDLLASDAPLTDAQGRVYGRVTIYLDITERNRFLGIAAHELRNPMAGVKAVLGLLHRRMASAQPTADLLRMAEVAEREVDRLGLLLNEILDAFRVQEGRLALRRQRIDLADVVTAACRSLVVASERIALQGVSRGPVWVWGDGQRLEEVVRNLVGNAVKYSPEGAEIQVTVSAEADRACLSVADHGVGIPKDQMGRVFEEFFRASNLAELDPGGLGLGLYICKDIVRRHGGRIWVESEEGQGSTFFVELPRLADAQAS